jgi:hypothetical protein
MEAVYMVSIASTVLYFKIYEGLPANTVIMVFNDANNDGFMACGWSKLAGLDLRIFIYYPQKQPQ